MVGKYLKSPNSQELKNLSQSIKRKFQNSKNKEKNFKGFFVVMQDTKSYFRAKKKGKKSS
jgi:hypothetical protein